MVAGGPAHAEPSSGHAYYIMLCAHWVLLRGKIGKRCVEHHVVANTHLHVSIDSSCAIQAHQDLPEVLGGWVGGACGFISVVSRNLQFGASGVAVCRQHLTDSDRSTVAIGRSEADALGAGVLEERLVVLRCCRRSGARGDTDSASRVTNVLVGDSYTTSVNAVPTVDCSPLGEALGFLPAKGVHGVVGGIGAVNNLAEAGRRRGVDSRFVEVECRQHPIWEGPADNGLAARESAMGLPFLAIRLASPISPAAAPWRRVFTCHPAARISGMTARAWCFTGFDLTILDRLPTIYDEGGFRFCVAQVERGSETCREHVQGYVEFRNSIRMSGIKALFGDNALHLEKRRGNRDEARKYCRKEESRLWGPLEWGDFEEGGQGSRADLASLKRRIDEGDGDLELAELDFGTWLRYHKGFERYRYLRARSNTALRAVQVLVIQGPSGFGKSYQAYDLCPGAYRLAPPNQRGGAVWWDGYNGHRDVIIDDFDGWMGYRSFLTLLDPYPLQLPVKGGFAVAEFTRVIITTIVEPKMWYPEKDGIEVLRRIESVRILTTRWDA